jgi:hypothetical protein
MGCDPTQPHGEKAENDVCANVHPSGKSLAVSERVKGLVAECGERCVPAEDASYEKGSCRRTEGALDLDELRDQANRKTRDMSS